MRFSVWPSPGRPVDEILDLARLTDGLGWYGFWFADHYMGNTGSTELVEGDVHEAWSVLPAVAMVTEQMRIGPLVAPTSVHHPALLANRAATIDHLSKGRMVLGLGAGWQINEHHAYGIELEAPGPRVSRFEEAIQIVRHMLDNDHTDFDGDFYTFINAPSDPKPIQDKLPIVVGTGGPRMCRITARHADEWNTWGAAEMATERCATFTAACEKVDVDPASLHTSVQAMFFLTDDADKIAKIKAGDAGERSIAGSPEQIIDAIGSYVELGFDEVIVPDFTLGATQSERFDAYELFSAEIVPHFAD
jgi:alkanesulfonate monooxygenase SsuD/methylene tetrahydromethanopterin reductase-like flavin-dependent oxidoreductase (luciferase family)